MNEDKFQHPQQSSIRKVFRVAGPVFAGLGLLFIVVGIDSFFMSFGTFEPPRNFWCAFVGMTLLFVGLVGCKLGYLGDVVRYISGETAPVAKDVVNYMGENTQPGVRAVTKAATEGVMEAMYEQQKKM